LELSPAAALAGAPEMARLRKDDTGERRTAFLGFQLTPAERAEIDRRAAVTGRHVSDYGRMVLLSPLKAPAPSARDPQAIRELAGAISRVGNNWNQMTHLAHEHGALPTEKALAAVMDEIIAALDKVRAL
jgi:hypothetical protein